MLHSQMLAMITASLAGSTVLLLLNRVTSLLHALHVIECFQWKLILLVTGGPVWSWPGHDG
jgi:uncharacterized membrane protein